ncbi:Pyruvate kinase family protein isoform 2, partial [Theobroma cacao]
MEMNNHHQGTAEMEKKSKTKIVCTLGPASRSVPMIEKLLRAGMNVARFNFSHGSHAYHQETLDNLRAAMLNTGILCAVMLDTKVENQEGVANFDDILANSDAFMVARGDLGMEIPIEKIFLAQKVMVYKCNIQGKPVVTATQMLESMIKSPRPTRAEATDVANAVLDGTDCVMLSGETAAGAYPELAVQTMAKICVEAESTLDYGDVFKRVMEHSPVPMSPLESLASSAVRTANSAKAALILVLTRGGSTAKLVAKYRPGMPILSVVVPEIKTDSFDWSCSDESPARHSLIFRGLIPVLYAGSARASHEETTEEALDFAIQHAKAKGLCENGDS